MDSRVTVWARRRAVRWVRERRRIRYRPPRAPVPVRPPVPSSGGGDGREAPGHGASTLLGLLPDLSRRDRVLAAIRRSEALRLGRWRLEECPSEAALFQAAQRTAPTLLLVGDGPRVTAAALISLVDRFRASFPMIPVVVYLGPHSRSGRGLVELGRHGVAEVIEWGVSDRPSTLAELMVRVGRSHADRRVLERALELVPPEFHRMISWGFAEATTGRLHTQRLSVDRITWLWRPGAHPSTLGVALRRAGLPPPGWWARWLVALRAVSVLQNPGATVSQIALTFGFDSDAALREFLRRLTGRPPSRLNPECLLELLESSIRHRRLR